MRTACAHLGPPLLGTNKAPRQMPPQPLVRPARGVHRLLSKAMHGFARSTRTASLMRPSARNIAGLTHSSHTSSGAQKGLSRCWAGRLVGAEEQSKEGGTRSVLRHLTRRSCLTGADFRPRREFSDATSLRAPQESPACKAGPPTSKPRPTPTRSAPRALPTKRPTPASQEKTKKEGTRPSQCHEDKVAEKPPVGVMQQGSTHQHRWSRPGVTRACPERHATSFGCGMAPRPSTTNQKRCSFWKPIRRNPAYWGHS